MKRLNILTISAALLGLLSFQSEAQTVADELLDKGRKAYMDYDFDGAAEHYANARKKAGKKASVEFLETLDLYNRQLTMAENFLERVEKIEIIDSITVPKKTFFKNYLLPPSSGYLGDGAMLPNGADADEVDYVFTNEGGDYKLWAQPDSSGVFRLMEAIRLTDGSWNPPAHLDDELSEGGDAVYPFMMADGVTLYYADNGDNSMGGYDIMVATRDAADGEFLQPQNLGMPYNSPFDDYLLAVDELNGVGWWATDRKQLGDSLTVFLFKVNDLRRNHSPEDENLTAFARVDDIILTQDPDSNFDSLLEEIKKINPAVPAERNIDFIFPMRNGKIYYEYSDFKNAGARAMMKKYMAAKKNLDEKSANLSDLRREYYDTPVEATATKIRRLEADTERDRVNVDKLRSEVYRAEVQ